ncbi:SSS family solute:Na+ symporter [Coniochaeta sp. 2T2.1]|nr:SSS family solute:Na+ symporter [Coniochaeta sp. 2T2.1]
MSGVSYLQNRYTKYSTKMSEEFNTATATLLQASTVAYEDGVSGPFWYAAGATVQIFMFSELASKVKQNALRCHTFLENIYYRYGKVAHWIFIFFTLMTNILVASQLLLGGSPVVTTLTRMNVYVAIFLIPLGVAVYVVLGGLRATFPCDYTHTIVVMLIILYFRFSVYTSNGLIGSPGRMYDLLVQAGELRPVKGNYEGSYVTLKSNYVLMFGVLKLCSGIGPVFLGQGYWQRAIASRPTTAVRGYIMGCFAWDAIPFGFAATLGLAAVALTDNPAYPTYPNDMTPSQVSSGLAAPFGAAALLGKHGCIALLITVFTAVASSLSSELMAVSSILTLDVYKVYIKPTANPKDLIFDQTRAGAIASALSGLAAGLIAWLVEVKVYYGEFTIATTGAADPIVEQQICNMAGVLTGLIVTTVVSLVKPDNFEWSITRDINAPSSLYGDVVPDFPTVIDEEKEEAEDAAVLENQKALQRTFMMALIVSMVLSITMDVIIPLPLFFSHYIYPKGFFTFYIVISFLWIFVAFGLEVFTGCKKIVTGVSPAAVKAASKTSASGTVTPAVHHGATKQLKTGLHTRLAEHLAVIYPVSGTGF